MKKLLPIAMCVGIIVAISGCSDSGPEIEGPVEVDEQLINDVLNAINSHDVERVRTLIASDPNVVGVQVSGLPFVMIAAHVGNLEIMKLLIENDADVNARNYSEETALIYAARNGHKEIVQLLIDNGADVNASSDTGTTALAVASDHPDIVALLKAKDAR